MNFIGFESYFRLLSDHLSSGLGRGKIGLKCTVRKFFLFLLNSFSFEFS